MRIQTKGYTTVFRVDSLFLVFSLNLNQNPLRVYSNVSFSPIDYIIFKNLFIRNDYILLVHNSTMIESEQKNKSKGPEISEKIYFVFSME